MRITKSLMTPLLDKSTIFNLVYSMLCELFLLGIFRNYCGVIFVRINCKHRLCHLLVVTIITISIFYYYFPLVTIIDKLSLLRSLVFSHFIHNLLFQVICTSTVFTLSSFKHRTRHIDCSTSKKHEVNKNDLIVVN